MSGLKNPDLSLFRTASIARKTNVQATGGDVYVVAGTSSDMSVLWGEGFGTKERKFLRELIASQTISYSLKDTYQIHVRTLWHPGASTTSMSIATGLRRQGKFALLIHDLVGELTTSWTWAKFIRPLYRKGFSIIACDLPGFGKSSVAQVCSCPLSRWQGQEAHVIAKIMEELSVSKCQILAVGQTCGMLLHVLESSPHRMAGEHVLVNPVFDRNSIFSHVDHEPPPGAKAGWQEAIKAKQQAALVDLLRTTGIRLWCLFDREMKYQGMKELKEKGGVPTTFMTRKEWEASKKLNQEWENAADTYEMLSEASKNEHIAANLKVTEITRNDLCEAQCGKRIPVRMFMPSRHLKASVARFMSAFQKMPWEHMFQPNHIAFRKGNRKNDGTGTHEVLGESRLDDSDEDDSDEEGSKAERDGSKRTLMDRSASKLMALEDRATANASSELRRHEEVAARMGRSASEVGMSMQSGSSRHTLCAAAQVAAARLKKSGANAKVAIISAETSRDMKSMNWAKVKFETDLSYGVRKQLLDTFEASVETYKVEQEKEYDDMVRHHQRTALRLKDKIQLDKRERRGNQFEFDRHGQ